MHSKTVKNRNFLRSPLDIEFETAWSTLAWCLHTMHPGSPVNFQQLVQLQNSAFYKHYTDVPHAHFMHFNFRLLIKQVCSDAWWKVSQVCTCSGVLGPVKLWTLNKDQMRFKHLSLNNSWHSLDQLNGLYYVQSSWPRYQDHQVATTNLPRQKSNMQSDSTVKNTVHFRAR